VTDAAHRRRRHAEPDESAVACPLLVDWLDSEPSAGAHLARVLVIGTRADAEVFGAADLVVQAASPELIPARAVFDLVVAVDCLRAERIDAQLERMAGAVGDGGRLLVIAATDDERPDLLTAAQLSPLRSAGLRPVAFDDLTEQKPGEPFFGRWLRALYQRGGDIP
jgi:hypothetical protein